jgi:protoheme ferro-lyase
LSGVPIGLGFNEFIAPHFPDVAEGLLADGAAGLVFVPMMLTDSSHTQEIGNKIMAFGLEKRGIRWVLSRPLFYRLEPTLLVVEKILAAAGSDALDRTGVILCCHGEPDSWTRASLINTRCNEQETAFCYAVKKGLVERGFSWDNIVRGFNEFTAPDLPEAVQILTERTVRKVIAIATFGTTDCLHVNYDIPTRIRAALDCPDIELVCLDGWNDDPLLIKAYAELARDAIRKIS